MRSNVRWPWSRSAEEVRSVVQAELRSLSFQNVFGQGLDIDTVRTNSITNTVSLVPVFACTRLIADSIAAMPLEAYRKVGDDRVPIDLPPLFADPSIFGGTFEWVQRALISLVLRGGTFGYITSFTYDGWPRQVEWLHPDEFSVMQDNITWALRTTGRADWQWMGSPIRQWMPRGVGIPGELVYVPWYVIPGFIRGISPIAAFRTTIEGGLHAQRYGRDWFKSGGRPSAVLESDQPINQVQANEVKARYKAAQSGQDVAVIGAGLHYKAITVPPEEAQFLDTIRATASQIASIYGLPAHKVGGDVGPTHKTYANVEQESQDLVNALLPYLSKLEQAFSNMTPRGVYVKFNVDSLVRADLKTRYEAHQIALGMNGGQPFMTVDEVRAVEDMQPMAIEQQDTIQPPRILSLPAPQEEQAQ